MDPSERQRRVSAEAAEWWLELTVNEMPRALRVQYANWLCESPLHGAEMLRIAQVHDALEQFERWPDVDAAGLDAGDALVDFPQRTGAAAGSRSAQPGKRLAIPPGGRTESSARRRFWIGAAAASLFALATGAGILLDALRGQVIATERGERREMALSDGSVLKVDAETRIRIRFRERERRVFLEQGRALFRVAKAPNWPFLVYVDGTVVRAVGTEFGVERQERGVVVTVADGQVAVGAARSAAADPTGSGPHVDQAVRSAADDGAGLPGNRSAASEIFLTANQQLTVHGSGTDLIPRAVDSSRALAWAEGRLVFENDTIAAVISQFNRYNHVQLRVIDPVLAGRQISGVFDAADSESFVAFLQGVAAVRVIRDEPQVVTIAPAQ